MGIPIKQRLVLWLFNNFVKIDLKTASIETVRKVANNRDSNLTDGSPIALPKVENVAITGRNGSITLRMYFPNAQQDLPVMVFFHGGGFAIGNLDTHDKVCRRLCRDNQMIVVAVDYRLAPEYKFPAAPEDCYDATQWVADNIQKYGGNPNKLIVIGDSAGANLATVTAIQARDAGSPKIAFQVLVYPCTDARMQHPSIDKFAHGYILTKELMQWFMNHYSRTAEDQFNPLMSPLLTPNLSNLPPILIQTGGYDPLQDEGTDYAERLKQAGNAVIHTHYPDLIHTFLTTPKLSKKCLAAHEEIAAVLNGFR